MLRLFWITQKSIFFSFGKFSESLGINNLGTAYAYSICHFIPYKKFAIFLQALTVYEKIKDENEIPIIVEYLNQFIQYDRDIK
jgi:hypothetical protein